ncbi:MAG: hypothetical protein JXP34_11510, partial [Planctomycetes bacterium]|nr:hypothetical protein [Planctomycetota bacterium]
AALERIAGDGRKVGELMQAIAAATQEQAQGMDQINVAISQIDQLTQSHAASAEETASAAMQLNAQARGLLEIVDGLEMIIRGGNGADARDARPEAPPSAGTAWTESKKTAKATAPRTKTPSEARRPAVENKEDVLANF